MTSDSELRDNGQPSSPTVSAVASLVSEKTEEHRKLYDHRLHQELTIKKPTEPAAAAGGLGSHSQMKGRRMSQFNSTLSTGITFGDDSDDEYSNMQSHALKANEATKTVSARPSRVAHSMSHQQQLYSISHEKVTEDTTASGMIPTDNPRSRRGSRTQSGVGSLRRKMSRAQSDCSSQGGAVHFLSKTFSHRSQESAVLNTKRNRRLSVDSDDSNASRESQETEEDVCFPMQQPEHTRINGIDFDELEEFVAEAARSRLAYNTPTMVGNVGMDLDAKYATSPGTSSGTSVSVSSAALKYTPKSTTTQKNSSPEDMAPGISFGDNKVENDEYIPMGDISQQYDMNGIPDARPGNYALPDRFSLFRSDLGETNHSPDIPSLIKDGENFRDLFRDGTATWWLDCICPTDEEMRCIAKAFGIHPLTAEDIRMQEAREKVELFKSYYFVCFHTFENDPESEDFLEPINMYVVVFRDGLLTFHYSPVSHPSNVRRRVRQLRDYVDVNSDWICYALIDDITDSFAPVIQSIEYEADLIEDSVFHSRDADVAAMLQTIGEGRRKTMTLMRLLSGKADVIKMFAKRCQDEANGIGPALTSEINIANLQFQDNKTPFQRNAPPVNLPLPQAQQHFEYQQRSQPRADVALYLGDIQDHVVTMFQNLSSYEKIFSRSHSNYLAQLQVESFRCNNRVTEMLGKVTMVGTMLVPLNVITGLFGMNVHVPGQADDAGGGFGWFFSIVAFLLFLAVTSCILSSWWISRANRTVTLNEAAEAGTRSILNFRRFRNNPRQNRQKMAANKSVISCPSKYGRYY